MVAIALSLVSLPGAISKEISLPSLHLVKANLAPNEAWYPAGPAMNSLQMVIFTDQFSETTSINQALNNPSQSSIDLSDTPIHAPDNTLVVRTSTSPEPLRAGPSLRLSSTWP